MKFQELLETDFFTFFNIHEQSASSGQINVTTKHLKPGGFQEFVDIECKVLPDGTLTEARLILDNEWIGNLAHINPFANDIAKSFISLFAKAEKHHEAEMLSEYLSHLKGASDKVIYAQEHEPRITKLPEELEGAIHVYLGGHDAWDSNMGDLKLELALIAEKKIKVLLRVEYFDWL